MFVLLRVEEQNLPLGRHLVSRDEFGTHGVRRLFFWYCPTVSKKNRACLGEVLMIEESGVFYEGLKAVPTPISRFGSGLLTLLELLLEKACLILRRQILKCEGYQFQL